MVDAVADAVVAFLPCRKGSERVPRKNIRPFGPHQHGLVEVKLGQLLRCQAIDRVILSTNDEEILELATGIGAGSKLVLHDRDDQLSSSATSTDELVGHAHDLIAPLAPKGHILWTHVTSPFVTSAHYDELVESYRNGLVSGYDSLMTVTQLHAFLWNEKEPINYDRSVEKWPRTQTLQPLFEVNSAAFLAPVSVYAKNNDRIGDKPRLYTLDKMTSYDIDWEEDFALAEQLLQSGLATTERV